MSWEDAVRKTIERVQSKAKNADEAEVITNKKIEAIRSHKEEDGNILTVQYEKNGLRLIEGIVIK